MLLLMAIFSIVSILLLLPQDKDGPPKSRYLDFLDILLSARDDAGQGLTPLEIRNEVDTFLFAGMVNISRNNTDQFTTINLDDKIITIIKRIYLRNRVRRKIWLLFVMGNCSAF